MNQFFCLKFHMGIIKGKVYAEFELREKKFKKPHTTFRKLTHTVIKVKKLNFSVTFLLISVRLPPQSATPPH